MSDTTPPAPPTTPTMTPDAILGERLRRARLLLGASSSLLSRRLVELLDAIVADDDRALFLAYDAIKEARRAPWPPERVSRHEDMSPSGRLTLTREDDGDIIVAVATDKGHADVQFCTHAGGGKSLHTLRALAELMCAMRADDEAEAGRG